MHGHASVVSADFDSLVAKVVVTASTWEDTVKKAQRALDDTHIGGIKTNLSMLRAIVAHPDFLAGACDTQWLENNQAELLSEAKNVSPRSSTLVSENAASLATPAMAAANTLFRKGDAWSLTLTPPQASPDTANTPYHHLSITRIHQNNFPTNLTASILFTTPSQPPITTPYILTLASTNASASATTSSHRRADSSDPSHVGIPFPGKLVELLVDEGDVVTEGDVVCVVQQMKMELEVRSAKAGRVVWVMDIEDGEEVAEGTLAAVVESEKSAKL